MIAYRNDLTYRNNQFYRPRGDGVYQKPALCNSVSVGVFSAAAANAVNRALWAELPSAGVAFSAAWGNGTAAGRSLGAPWGRAIAQDSETSTTWRKGAAQNSSAITHWEAALPAGAEMETFWRKAGALEESLIATGWLKTRSADAEVQTKWVTISHRYTSEFYRNNAPYRGWHRWNLPTYKLTLDAVTHAPWGDISAKEKMAYIPWGGGFSVWGVDTPLEWTSDTSPIPDQEAPPEPEIKDVYLMATDLTVKDVETGTPLLVDGVSISLDVDSFAWRCSLRALNQSSMSLMMPSKEIEVSTMSWRWVFVVERYTKTRGVGSTWQVQASSKSKKLDAPWADAESYTNTAATSFMQAAESLLPQGWQVEWHKISDYPIPQGAWSYNNKTIKEALADMLDAIGAVIVPDPEAETLHIQPRYKYAPWEYYLETTEPDMIVHESMILAESGEYRPGKTCNGVWVGGNTRHGVIVDAMRSGSDGQPYAQDVFHPLITHQDAAQQRAKQVISASGEKTLVTIETFITDEQASPGLIRPGDLVEVVSEGETWRGICLGVSMADLGAPRITQTVVLERSHGNNN